jgi:hypothetical protein
VVGKLFEFISKIPFKYNDPRNQVVTIEMNGISLPNTLIDLGVAINVMHVGTMQTLQVKHLRSTQNLLELAYKSVISPTSILGNTSKILQTWTSSYAWLTLVGHS